MNTVLPARDSPVTPSRTVGWSEMLAEFGEGAGRKPRLFDDV